MRKKVLIFYISAYSGHQRAAEAIENGLGLIDDGVQVEKINALEYTSPLLGKLINKAYIELIKKNPELWGRLYDNPDVMKKTQKAREVLHNFNMTKIRKLLDESSPEVVYCTQAFPCGMVADYKRSCGADIKLVAVLTDHAPHSYWIQDEVDNYITPSEDIKEALAKKGVPADKIIAHGIPVDPKFAEAKDPTFLKKELSLKSNLPSILIMGGSQGLGSMAEVVRSLLEDTRHQYQLLVVTGSNKHLYSRLKKLAKNGNGENLHLFQYVENIDELMEVSDVIVTKAGGMTISEALTKSLPMVIVSPIPGHEKLNTEYLVDKGAAIEVGELTELHNVINGIFDSKDTMDAMKKAIKEIAKPNSASDIAKLAFEEN